MTLVISDESAARSGLPGFVRFVPKRLHATTQHSLTEVIAFSASLSVLYRPSVLYRVLSDGSVVTMVQLEAC